nr:DUF4126 domain-containing protein [Methanomassiliicoccus sp.]
MELEPALALSILLSIALGVGLSAAAGFRVFVPFLVMSAASLTGHLSLTGGWSWIGTYPALVVFAVATVLEVIAYYVPWLDNALDLIATPAAVVAGIVLTASVVSDVSPLLRWTLAIIAGGGTAAVVQTGTVLLRGLSSTTTLGFGNFTVSTAELAGSVLTSVLAVVIPLLALVLVVILLIWIVRRLRSVRKRLHARKQS